MTHRRSPHRAKRTLFWSALSLCAGLVAISPALSGCQASCKPQEVRGLSTNCSGGARGYMWTGTSCIYTAPCNCTGADCQRLYATQTACETAHIHCTP